MRKRRIYLGVQLLAVAGLVSLIVAGALREREPEYGGKNLSEWVEELGFHAGKHLNPPWKARGAVAQIGTNAIPYLLTWIRYEPAHSKTELFAAINRTFGCRLLDHRNARATGAARALQALQSKAEGAIPGLALLMDDANHPIRAQRVTAVLHDLGRDLLSADLALMTNKSAIVRSETIDLLSLGQKNVPALPILFQGLHDTDAKVAEKAAWYLGAFGGKTNLVITQLAETLKDGRAGVRQAAIGSLLRFGTQASPAVSSLRDLVKGSDPQTRKMAIYALEVIEPEALERAGK